VVKDPNIYRILMLGDSFTMGKGVQDDETFSSILEESLKSKKLKIKGKTVQVLNAGVNSYAPIISFLQLKKQLWKLEPDLVVLNLDMSDLIQELAYRNAANYGDDGEIIGVSGASPTTWLWFLGALPPKEDEDKESKIRSAAITLEIRRWINRHLFITRLLSLWIDGVFKESEEITIDNTVTLRYGNLLKHTLAADESDIKEQWEKVFDSIKKIKKYCDDHDIDFLLTIYPWAHQVNDKEWASGRKDFIPDNSSISDRSIYTILDLAEKENIKILNVFRSFRSYNDTAPLYFNHDMHWTPKGHQLMAEELEQFLIRR
jgi:lysophospholipase L1-like esterase